MYTHVLRIILYSSVVHAHNKLRQIAGFSILLALALLTHACRSEIQEHREAEN